MQNIEFYFILSNAISKVKDFLADNYKKKINKIKKRININIMWSKIIIVLKKKYIDS